MPITALPTPPQRSDPANFASRGDAFMTALPTFATEANALATTVNADAATASAAASTATTQAGNASTSAGTATTQAGIATTQAGIATTQAGNALASANAAAASAATINLTAPGPIGGTTPSTGAFTTLSATSGVAVGGATPQTSGIAFPAIAVGVANVNTLDDYEEGTWTPSIGGTATYITQNGRYTKIGNVVTIVCDLAINLRGTGSQEVISGLPFAISGAAVGAVSHYISLAITPVTLSLFSGGGSTMSIWGTTAAASGAAGLNALGNSSRIVFSATYYV